MTDEGKLRDQHARGEEAKRILENDLVQEVLETMEEDILNSWKESKGDDEGVRYNAYLMYRLTQNFKHHFTKLMTTGEHARKQLLEIERKGWLKR